MGVDGSIIGNGATHTIMDENFLKKAHKNGNSVHLSLTYDPTTDSITFNREGASNSLELIGNFVNPDYKKSVRVYVNAVGNHSSLILQ